MQVEAKQVEVGQKYLHNTIIVLVASLCSEYVTIQTRGHNKRALSVIKIKEFLKTAKRVSDDESLGYNPKVETIS